MSTKNSSIRAVFDTMQKAVGSVFCLLLLSSQASLLAPCPCGRHRTSSQSNTYQERSRELCLGTEASSSRPGKKGINSEPPPEWVPCTSCTRAVKDSCGTESIRPCRTELQKKQRPLIIFIFENYFREITHMSKIVKNAPPSSQPFC